MIKSVFSSSRWLSVILLGHLTCIPAAVAEVGPQGSFQTQVAIALPGGIQGIKPNIALAYDSNAGDGIAGLGWELAGIPSIQRVEPRTGYTYSVRDDFRDVDGDLYRMNDAAAGEYRFGNRRENWLLYRAKSGCAGDICSWTVTDRGGNTLTFGGTPDSVTYLNSPAGTIPRAWYLNEYRDRFGNFYTIAYQRTTPLGTILPASIEYTKNAKAEASGQLYARWEVTFTYEQRPEPLVTTEQGFPIQIDVRLKSVSTAFSFPNAAPRLFRMYSLRYAPSLVQSRLASVEESGTGGAAETMRTEFAWERTAAAMGVFSAASMAKPIRDAVAQWAGGAGTAVTKLIDQNGDGVQDLVVVDKATILVVHGTTLAGSVFSSKAATTQADVPLTDPRFADFNGDGCIDILSLVADAGATRLLLGQPDGTFVARAQAASLGSTLGVQKNNPEQQKVLIADIDADGREDLLFIRDGQPAKIAYSSVPASPLGKIEESLGDEAPAQLTPSKATVLLLADFDGDGKSDLFRCGKDGRTFLRLWQNTASHPFGSPVVIGASATAECNNKSPLVELADVNGDSQLDVLVRTKNADAIDIHYFRQSTFSLANAKLTRAVAGEPSTSFTGDFTGDGATDLLLIDCAAAGCSASLYPWEGAAFAQNPMIFSDFPAGAAASDLFLPGDFDGDRTIDLLYAKRANSVLSRGAFSVMVGSARGLRKVGFDLREEGELSRRPTNEWDRRPIPLPPVKLAIEGGAPQGFSQLTFFADNLAAPLLTDLDGDGRTDIFVAGNASKDKQSFALTARFLSAPKLEGILSPTGAITSITYQPKRSDLLDTGACVPLAGDSASCGLRDNSALDVVRSIATWTHQPRAVWSTFTDASPDELMTYEFSTPTYFASGPQGPKWGGFRRVAETDETRHEVIERLYHQGYALAGLLAEERKWLGGALYSLTKLTHKVLKSIDEDATRSLGLAELVDRETTELHSEGTLAARKEREFAYSFGYSTNTRDCISRVADNNVQAPTCFETISHVEFPDGPHRPVLTGICRQSIPENNDAPMILDWTRFEEGTVEGDPLSTELRLLCADAERCASEADGQFHPVTRLLARDAFGQPIRVKDVSGREAETTFDRTIPEAMTKETDAFGNSTTFTLDDWGRTKTSTDANGQITSFAYDGLGRLMRTDFASPGTFERRIHVNEGDAASQYVETTRSNDDIGNTTISRDYLDGAGRVYRSTRSGPDGRDIVVDLGQMREGGLLTTYESEAFFSDSSGPMRWRATSFDALGRATYVRWLRSFKAGDLANAKPETFQAQRIEYRSGGLKIVNDGRPYVILERVDEQGRVTERVRATEDRSAAAWNEIGSKTRYAYDAAGRLTKLDIAEPDGSDPRAIEQRFDSWGRRVSLLERIGGLRTFRVRLDGETELETHADGASIGRTFYPDGRLQSVISTPENRAFSFVYDESDVPNGKGRLTRIKSAAGDEWRFGYDEMGRISQKTYMVHALADRKFFETFAYDGAGRVASRRMPEGTHVSYRYSPVGALAAVLLNGLEVARWEEFDAEGRANKRTTRGSITGLEPEIETRYKYVGPQLDSIVHTRSGVREEIGRAKYQFKPSGDIDSISATDSSGKFARTRYDYDHVGRLQSADARPGSKSVFTYNAFGDVETFGGRANRTLRYHDDGGGGYSICDELAAGSCRNSWSFDGDGLLASRLDEQQRQQQFSFSADGLLLSVTSSDGSKLQYDYDALGLRTRATMTQDGTTVDVHYIGSDFEIHVAGDSDSDRRYSIHIGTPDGSRLATITTTPTANASLKATPLMSLPAIDRRSATALLPPVGTWFYHVNHLGSIWFVTDSRASVEYRASYYPYGESLNETGDPVSSFSFTGARADQVTGFIYMSGRYYEPRIGRFISPDPFLVSGLGDTNSGNRYAYAANQPLSFIDPSGYGWHPDRDLRNLGNDLVRDTRNLGRHLEAGVRDLGRTGEAVVRETFRGARQFGKDLVSDPLYAVVHIPRYTIRYPERALRNGLLQSQELTVVAMVAVSIATGPAGTGAFTAYMTYAAGGSIEDAAKAGAIAWATGYLMSEVDVKFAGSDEVASRVIAKGAISGASSVARGGTFEAGFKAGATSAAIAESLSAMTGKEPTYRAGTNSRLKPDGYSIDDLRQDHLLKHVGMTMDKAGSGLLEMGKYHLLTEGGFLMDHVADVPGMSYLGYIHDYFVMSIERATNASVAMLFNQTTIASAIAVNYYALGFHRDRMLLELSMRNH